MRHDVFRALIWGSSFGARIQPVLFEINGKQYELSFRPLADINFAKLGSFLLKKFWIFLFSRGPLDDTLVASSLNHHSLKVKMNFLKIKINFETQIRSDHVEKRFWLKVKIWVMKFKLQYKSGWIWAPKFKWDKTIVNLSGTIILTLEWLCLIQFIFVSQLEAV